jgi:hypothetical protein
MIRTRALRSPLLSAILILPLYALVGQNASPPGSNSYSEVERQYIARLDSILFDYFELMDTHVDRSRPYYEGYAMLRQRVRNGESGFAVALDSDSTVYGGAWFSVRPESGEYWIAVGRGLIDIHHRHPSLVYAVITHELRHARDYLLDPDNFLEHNDDPIDKHLFERAAAYIEGLFIDEVLIPRG